MHDIIRCMAKSQPQTHLIPSCRRSASVSGGAAMAAKSCAMCAADVVPALQRAALQGFSLTQVSGDGAAVARAVVMGLLA